ncbi:MAG: hypothetical protein WBC29_01845 [Candidatus Moraniibacteriota bacterium]
MERLFTGHRVEDYKIEMLTADDEVIGALRYVSAAKISANYEAMIRRGMTMDVDRSDTITWGSVRFRPWVVVNGVAWPLGVYLPSSPNLTFSEDGISASVTCLDKTSILDQDKVDEPYSVDAGVQVVPLVQQIVESTGETNIALTPSSLTTRQATVWSAGTTKLAIVNEMLGGINYDSIWCDGFGQFHADPYILPSAAQPRMTFVQGETAVHKKDYTYAQDLLSVPNKVIVVSQSSGDSPALIGIATDTNPASPFSYAARGNRWITTKYEGVQAADQATVDALALRYLRGAATPPGYLQIQHAVVQVKVPDIVEFQSHPTASGVYQVNEMSLDLKPGALVSGKWKKVVA